MSKHVYSWIKRSLMSFVIVFAVGFIVCAGQACSSRRTRSSVDAVSPAIECGIVDIQPSKLMFKNALEISYRISMDHRRYCTIASDYIASVSDAAAVELRHASETHPTTRALTLPLVFEPIPRRVRQGEDTSSRIDRRPVSGDGPIYVTPAGDYRLLFKYRTGRCSGERFDTVCLAVSHPFHLDESVRFTVEESILSDPASRAGSRALPLPKTPSKQE
jgi:hypothetical protein